MTDPQDNRPKPGEMVVLMTIPPGLLDDLPAEDQAAIAAIVGEPVMLNEYDIDGRAELEFEDRDGNIHHIYVGRNFIRAAK